MAATEDRTRLGRARIIRDAVLAAGRLGGRWRSVDLGNGRIARNWEVDGEGWTATITTRFSGVPGDVEVKAYEEALLLQLAPPRRDDVEVDVYHPEAGKVLSIGKTGEHDTLIGMQAGPWEAAFGLPARDWSPATARRLSARKAKDHARSG